MAKINTTTLDLSIQSSEKSHFEIAMDDVQALLSAHDKETNKGRGKPSANLEVFKRAAVILAITAWETFIEDTIRSCAKARIGEAIEPKNIENTFNHVAMSSLQSKFSKPEDLAMWTGDGWKKKILEKLESDISDLNTPKSHKIRELSKQYLGSDLTASWKWHKTNQTRAATRLNDLIEKRGALVHRGRNVLEQAAVLRSDVTEALDLLPKLVACTEKALGREEVFV